MSNQKQIPIALNHTSHDFRLSEKAFDKLWDLLEWGIKEKIVKNNDEGYENLPMGIKSYVLKQVHFSKTGVWDETLQYQGKNDDVLKKQMLIFEVSTYYAKIRHDQNLINVVNLLGKDVNCQRNDIKIVYIPEIFKDVYSVEMGKNTENIKIDLMEKLTQLMKDKANFSLCQELVSTYKNMCKSFILEMN